MTIPLSIPGLIGNEKKYLNECVESNFVSSVGPFVEKFENALASFLKTSTVAATVNGTAALHLALELSGVRENEEVLAPALTFIAPVNAIRYVGAFPVFLDCDRTTLGLCPQKLAAFLDSCCEMKNGKLINKSSGRRISAILPVHILGTLCQIEEIVDIAKAYQLPVIEDASESLGASKNNISAGLFGDMGAISFNGNKIITCGAGGAFVSRNEDLVKRARHLSTTAKTDARRFVHDEVGYNYRLANPLAAIGLAQLEQLDEFLKIKEQNFYYYENELKNIRGLKLITPPNKNESNFWFYGLQIDENFPLGLNDLLESFWKEKIEVRPLWTLMSQLPPFQKCQKDGLENAQHFVDSTLCLPCSVGLTNEQRDTVVKHLKSLI